MPVEVVRRDPLQRDTEQYLIMQQLLRAQKGDAIGAAVAFLLHECETHPHVVRQVLRSRVERPGYRSREIIDVLNAAVGKV